LGRTVDRCLKVRHLMDQPRLPQQFLGALLRVRSISTVLLADIWRSHESVMRHSALEATDETKEYGQFLLRSYVRAFFAHVEGVCYAMRESLLELHEQGFLNLSPSEYCLLAEARYALDGGKPKQIMARSSSLDTMRFSFSQFAQGFGSRFTLNTSDHRWQAFQESWKLRHSVTHPKLVDDLYLSPNSIRQFGDAIGWFSEQMAHLLRASLDRT